jgi:hypothetical protein
MNYELGIMFMLYGVTFALSVESDNTRVMA